MTAKQYLSRYRQFENRIDGKNERIKELREKATSISIGYAERVQTSKTGDKATLFIEQYLMLEEEILQENISLRKEQTEIQETINKLLDENQKIILELHYINGLSLVEISEQPKTQYSYKQICRIHGKSLENIKNILKTQKMSFDVPQCP